MTDNELKALVASIAEGQKKTDAQLNRTDEQLNRTDALVASIAEGQKKTDIQLEKTGARIDELTRNVAEISRRVDKVSRRVDKVAMKVDKVAAMYGGMANNQGAIAEEFYFNTLKHNPVLQAMRFEIVYKNMTAMREGIEDEYDILLINGKAVYIIEVKSKAHFSDVQKLINKKAKNFPTLFPQYADYEHYLGLACFHIDDDTKDKALAAGVTILQRRGNLVETIATKELLA